MSHAANVQIDDLNAYMGDLGQRARAASRALAAATTATKDAALQAIAGDLDRIRDELMAETWTPAPQRDSMRPCWIDWNSVRHELTA